jgi:hypothetical protein
MEYGCGTIELERRWNVMTDKYRCPCCGYYTLKVRDNHDICEICFWKDDRYQRENIDEWYGANRPSLRVARRNYRRYGASNHDLIQYVRKPLKDEIKEIMSRSKNKNVLVKPKDGRKMLVKVLDYKGRGKTQGEVAISVVDYQNNECVQYESNIEDIQIINMKHYNPYYDAHEFSCYNKNELERDSICGCFYCIRIFKPSEIKEWVPEEEDGEECTALCPYCEIDSVIGKSSGYPITKEFLKEMNRVWF